MEYLLLVGGLVLLVVSGNYLIEAAVGIAQKFKLSPLIIGMTIVAFGTSAPELMVSVQAALGNHSEMALGNVLGSNIVNIGLILGVTALILPIRVEAKSIKVDWSFLMTISILLVALAWGGSFGRVEGAIAVCLLLLFTVYSIYSSRKDSVQEEYESPKKSFLFNIIIFVVACVGIAYGADFMVQGATVIASNLGVSERIISIFIIGVGTSLPELTASLVAAIKKEDSMSLGNIIGSNIFNTLSVLGITAIIKPITFTDANFHSDFIWMLVFTLLLYVGMINVKQNIKETERTKKPIKLFNTGNGIIGRLFGVLLIAVYACYIASQFL
ncbi:cation:H+ antiporter [Dysgonomonadaceae bacterium PH5-43]|nr:cation:H+ antiporter [Dysgonomonadaceae bacterium PH5-43]